MHRWIVLFFSMTLALAAQAGPITYQGQLEDSTGPVDTQVNMDFELYDQDEGGSPIASQTHNDVEVSDGLFQVELDFGSNAFDGGERWLAVIVDGQELEPRQPITPAPIAIHALNVPFGNLEDDFWSRSGNAGTTPGSDFMGTTDAAAFEIRVSGERALRLEPVADPDTAPNWIGGHANNETQGDPSGVTIAGGGEENFPNTASGNFATIGGGIDNTASGTSATIGGGFSGTASASRATVGGGQFNTAEGTNATVAGGAINTASGSGSSVPGGAHNEAVGDFSLAAGHQAKALHEGAFVWSHSNNQDFESTGEDQFLIEAGGGVGIGTNAPQDALHVVGIIRTTGGFRLPDGTLIEDLDEIEGSDTLAELDCTSDEIAVFDGSDWICSTAPSPVWALQGNNAVFDDGYVGIGTDSPGVPLEVRGSGLFGLEENTASGENSFVTGGNTVSSFSLPNSASGDFSAIAGGSNSIAEGTGSAITGGADNAAEETGSAIIGGQSNTAGGQFSSIAGGESNTAGGRGSTIVGGIDNFAGGDWAAIVGGRDNNASDEYAAVIGGQNNQASGEESFVGGGTDNTSEALRSAISGGWLHSANANGSFIAGGYNNITKQGFGTAIIGGRENTTGVDGGFYGHHAVVVGGQYHHAQGMNSFIGGGIDNTTLVDGENAAVVGGMENTASEQRSAVVGGFNNTASDDSAFIGGGWGNEASGLRAAIAGGIDNTASSTNVFIAGGSNNTAGAENTFAAGSGAQALHANSFVWSGGGSARSFGAESTAPNQFVVAASGAVRFLSDETRTMGVELAPGGSGWGVVSDRNAKTAIEPADPVDVLARVGELEISEYSYNSQDESIRHMGPMAQEFHPLFGLGEDELRINAMNLAGIALAAVQGLNVELQTRDTRLKANNKRIATLEAKNAELEERLSRLESLLLEERQVAGQ